MSENVHELLEQRHTFYEVTPYYVVVEERLDGAKAARRRIQAGFDIDVYGMKSSLEPEPSLEYTLSYRAIEEAVETVLAQTGDHCSIEVIPFPSTVILDTRRHLQPLDMLRIRITHTRGLDQPSGASEERALQETEQMLRDLIAKTRT